jgi:DNA modification methylase
MVKALDYEIGKLITILKEKNLYDKTDIYIFPDHVKMGLDRDVLNNLTPELFLLSNTKLSNKTIYQSDLIDIILSNSKVKHNQKFLSQLYPAYKLNQLYETDFEKINILNKAAFKRQNALGNPRSNHHPTVKPTDLMAYLCRLITPPHGVILDPFMGSGSTGKAALREGFEFVGIDREAEYCEIAKRRIAAEAMKLLLF